MPWEGEGEGVGEGVGKGWAVTGQEIIESILLPLKHPVLPRLSSFSPCPVLYMSSLLCLYNVTFVSGFGVSIYAGRLYIHESRMTDTNQDDC